MNKYTANYVYTNPNFVIENLHKSKEPFDIKSTYVLKNILQRGMPTTLSRFLQDKISPLHLRDDFTSRFLFCDDSYPQYSKYIDKSTLDDNLNLSIYLIETVFPQILKKYNFLIPLFCLNEKALTCSNIRNSLYANRKIDLYLPCLKLAIIIKNKTYDDYDFYLYLNSANIHVILINDFDIKNNNYVNLIDNLAKVFKEKEKIISFYRKFFLLKKNNNISLDIYKYKLIPTAIMRFQILILELIENNYLSFNKRWSLKILSHENLDNFAELAIEDILLFYEKLFELREKRDFIYPFLEINYVKSKDELIKDDENTILIDFSLFKRMDFEYLDRSDVIYIRTDYFDNINEKNYFRVSTTTPINYKITVDDKRHLEFFLQNLFDKETFREGQFPIISNILSQNDTVGLLPTGGGKSICYQLPSLLQPAINFVVCPIKSLMYDQKENLDKTYINHTAFITSDLDKNTQFNIEYNFVHGKYLLVWISPERFQILKFREMLLTIQKYFSIAYAVIDEVHCLSEWGHDFRTSYLNLTKTIDKISIKDSNKNSVIKFLGLTATASVNVLKNIKIEFARNEKELLDSNIKALLNYSREELLFEVIQIKDEKIDALLSLLKDLKKKDNFLSEKSNKTGIIFTPFVNGKMGCYKVYQELNDNYKGKVCWYSGSLPKDVKIEDLNNRSFVDFKIDTQNKFKNDEYKLMSATKAFGMGIDKENIFYTFHYGLPDSVEALYQEAGRAGRWDKYKIENKDKKAKCFILHNRERVKDEVLDRAFSKTSSFEDINNLIEKCKYIGKDVFKQLVLFVSNKHDTNFDSPIIINILKKYFQEKTYVDINFSEIEQNFFISTEDFEIYIYRLTLLGIVSDWITDFKTKYTIKFETLDENHIKKSLLNYIGKYEPNINLDMALKITSGNTFLEKSVNFLLSWIFLNIVYNKKQSLKTLNDWCCSYKDSRSFKERIDRYFSFNDTTFILQHIAENTFDIDICYKIIPINKTLDFDNLNNLKDSLSRFLESYRNNIGLNLLSSLIRLMLNEFNDTDGKNRLKIAILGIKTYYSKHDLIKKIKDIIKYVKILKDREHKLLFTQCILEECDDIDDFSSYFLEYFLFTKEEILEIKEKEEQKDKDETLFIDE